MRTLETANRVLLLFARGRSEEEAATALGISAPTLRKHYFSECERRAAAALMMEGKQLSRLNAQAETGNVAAEKELLKILERGRLAGQPAAAKPPKKGKKEQRHIDAASAHKGSSWGELVGAKVGPTVQ